MIRGQSGEEPTSIMRRCLILETGFAKKLPQSHGLDDAVQVIFGHFGKLIWMAEPSIGHVLFGKASQAPNDGHQHECYTPWASG